MDLYFLGSAPDRFRREVVRIEANDDSDATVEARRIGDWKKPAHFTVRSIHSGTRSSDREVFDSRNEAYVPLLSEAAVV
jgi:hypothetical protein